MKASQSKIKELKKSKAALKSTATSRLVAKKKLQNCFVKLGRIDVNKVVDIKRGRKTTDAAAVVPKIKNAVSAGLVQKRKTPVVPKVVGKAVNNLIIQDKGTRNPSAKPTTKSSIAGHDKALLKHTIPLTSKRTPKPNRRYMNEETVTKAKGNFYEDSEPEKVLEEDSDSSDGIEEPEADSSDEDLLVESPATRRRKDTISDAVTKSEPPKKRGRPPKQIIAKRKAETVQKATEVISNANKLALLKKRKLDMDSSDASMTEKRIMLKKKIRKERSSSSDNNTEEDSNVRNSTALRTRKSNPVSIPPVRKPITVPAAPTFAPKFDNSAQLAAKRSALSAALKQKLNTSAPTPQLERFAKQLVAKSVSANCTPISSPKFYGNMRQPAPIISTTNAKKTHIDPEDLEDFEQMPTFTIVNINDIINQKEDMVVLEKKGKRQAKGLPTNDADDVDYQPDADSIDEEEQTSFEEDNTKVSNRRKTQHTTLLSEKIKAGTTTKSSPPPKILNNKSPPVRPYRNIIKQNGLSKDLPMAPNKGAPRILNSTLCRNTLPTVEPRVLNDTLNNNNVVANNRSKENVIKTFASPRSGKTPQPLPKTVISQVVQTGSTRRVRKITCFETWFVIKLPVEEQPVHKAELTLSLVQLGNAIKQVPLPSEKWSYAISLLRKKAAHNNLSDELYTGEVQDANINPEERHLFVPSNIMFRRKSQNPALRMQFDRAVIFKNNTFFINIEGKNVKLLAAPSDLQSFSDIETLLQIVNEVSLTSPLVEQTNYVV